MCAPPNGITNPLEPCHHQDHVQAAGNYDSQAIACEAVVKIWVENGVIRLGEPQCDITNERPTGGEEELHETVELFRWEKSGNKKAESEANDNLRCLPSSANQLREYYQGSEVPFVGLSDKGAQGDLRDVPVKPSLFYYWPSLTKQATYGRW